MYNLKRFSEQRIPRAISKAERYRLLNEPRSSESICRDILLVDAGNQDALVILLLSITDQFIRGFKRVGEAQELISRLPDEYKREYYSGVIAERWAKTLLAQEYSPESVMDWFRQAMAHYEKAESLADDTDPDAILRWNTCVRIVEANKDLLDWTEGAPADGGVEEAFDDEVPFR